MTNLANIFALSLYLVALPSYYNYNKQLLDEVEHDIMNYQNRGLCYLPQPSASADSTDLGFDNS